MVFFELQPRTMNKTSIIRISPKKLFALSTATLRTRNDATADEMTKVF